jgi:hypothetical protein
MTAVRSAGCFGLEAKSLTVAATDRVRVRRRGLDGLRGAAAGSSSRQALILTHIVSPSISSTVAGSAVVFASFRLRWWWLARRLNAAGRRYVYLQCVENTVPQTDQKRNIHKCFYLCSGVYLSPCMGDKSKKSVLGALRVW